MIELSHEQKKGIGLQYVIDCLSPCSPYGAHEIRRLRAYGPGDEEILEKELGNLARTVKAYEEAGEHIRRVQHVLMLMNDIKKTLKKCQEHHLGEVELFEVKCLLLELERLIPAFDALNSRLALEGISFTSCTQALDLLDPENKRVATFYVSEVYSDRLRVIRREKREVEEELRRLGSRKPPDDLMVRRTGIIAREEQEETAVREYLSEQLRPWLGALLENVRQAGRLDLLLEKASLARRLGAVRPEISRDELLLADMFSPRVVELLKKQGKAFTPVSIRLGRGATVLTGANMGGKTVTLKTAVLNVMLMHMGFFVFARQARIPLFDSLHLVSENLQSVERGLSTFGAEVLRLKEVLAEERRGFAFIVLDEFASGTNPEEAAVILRALTRYLNEKNSISLLTTHFDGIAPCAGAHYQVTGLKNVDMQKLRAEAAASGGEGFDLLSRHMDYSLYRVEQAENCPRDALNICRFLSLDGEIMQMIEEGY